MSFAALCHTYTTTQTTRCISVWHATHILPHKWLDVHVPFWCVTWLSDDCHTWEWLRHLDERDMTWMCDYWVSLVSQIRESCHTHDSVCMFHSNMQNDSWMTVTHANDLISDEHDMTWMWLSGHSRVILDSQICESWHTKNRMYIFHSNMQNDSRITVTHENDFDSCMNVTWHECVTIGCLSLSEMWVTAHQAPIAHVSFYNVWPDPRMTVTHKNDLISDERDMTWMWLSGDSSCQMRGVMPHTHDLMYIFHSNVIWLSNDRYAWEDLISVTGHACDYWITLGSRICESRDTYVNHATHIWVMPHMRLNVHIS